MTLVRLLFLSIFFFYLQLSQQSHAVQALTYGGKNKVEIPKIRVMLKRGMKKVDISGLDLRRRFHKNSETKSFTGRKSIRFNCYGLREKNSFKKPQLLASLGSPTGFISLKKEKYKGLLHIITSPKNKSCDVIHETDIEDYLSALLSKEMNSKWPIEALKAQAIAARTYAIHKIVSKQVNRSAGHETFYHLESSEKHQVSGSFFDSTSKTQKASRETSGYILVDENENVGPAFFHAKCGGETLRPEHVWENEVESYQEVKCPFCRDHGKSYWKKRLTVNRFKTFLTWAIKKEYIKNISSSLIKKDIQLVKDHKYSRHIRVYLGTKPISFKKSLLRRYFGRFIVPSNNFQLKFSPGLLKKKAFFSFKGSGLGHGVGMCQLGALDLADQGRGFKEILAHYFPNHKLKKVY